jgi:hypothetical protein
MAKAWKKFNHKESANDRFKVKTIIFKTASIPQSITFRNTIGFETYSIACYDLVRRSFDALIYIFEDWQ